MTKDNVLFFYSPRIVGALLFSTGIAFLAAWYIGSYFNFAYPIWYELLDISNTIQVHGPQNIYKQQFSSTDSAQHLTLFAQIVEGISLEASQVKDYLGGLTYGNEKQAVIDTLLHSKEIQHLYDVSILLSAVKAAGLILALVGLSLFFFIGRKQSTDYIFRKRDVYFLSVPLLGLLTLLLLVFGFESVFYRLHDWFFPAGHQWFFYYYESLMTTLMKAPDLFAYIGAFLLLITLVLQWGLLSALTYIDKTRLNNS